MREIDTQLAEASGTTWLDSLHRYLFKYARATRKVKDPAAGAAAAERILAQVKARGNAAHEVEALFDLSWYYYEIGEMRQCARVDSLAVTVADGDPAIPFSQRGRARQYLAFDHSVIGDHRSSAKWALSALEQYAKADSIPPHQIAESYTAAGAAYWHLGRIRDAEAFYNKALAALGDGTSEEVVIRKVSTYGNLGVLWQNAGDFTRARKFYHESLRCSDRVVATTTDPFKRDEAIVNRSRTYLNLATVFHQLGDIGKARELLGMAYRDRSSVLQPDDPQLLTVQDRLADIELSAGELDKAERLTRTYAAVCEKKFGTRSEEYIRAVSKLGEIAQRNGDVGRADSLFNVSIAAGRANADAATDAVLVQTLQSRGQMRSIAGRHAEALADLSQARTILVNIYDSAHYKVADADVRLAEAAFQAGDLSAASAYARSALSILKDRIRALRTTKGPIAFPDPHILPAAIRWKVMADRTPGTDARPEWNKDLDLAISAIARNRAAVQDEASKLLLIAAQKDLFDLALDIAYDTWQKDRSEAAIERFLLLSETDRSTVLKGRLNAFAGIRFTGVPDSLIAREQELITALDVDEDDRTATTEMDRHEREFEELLTLLERDHPQYFDLRYGEPAITLGDVRDKLLNKDRQLLAYAFSASYVYALTIGLRGAQLVRMDRSGVQDIVRNLNAAIAARDATAYGQAAHTLYKAVFVPVAGHLRTTELLIIPDGPLQAVNFETLLEEPVGNGKMSDHLLIRRYAIGQLLSASTAVRFKTLASSAKRDVLAFAPGFSDELKQSYLSAVPDPALIDSNYLGHVRQPFAVSTAKELGGLMNAQVSIGADANEERFRDMARDFGVLHLGTHAEMNTTDPLYSRLVLSKDGATSDPDADGYLHAYEIYELDLRAQLAVLTACETGVGIADAEGVRSLGYGFAYAGCPSLVTSLWSIDEKVSAEIVTRFYRYLSEGMPKHLALRQAKLDHLDGADDELSQPYYWAGMVLVGDVEPVMGTGGTTRHLWWVLAVVAVVAVAGLVRWWRRR